MASKPRSLSSASTDQQLTKNLEEQLQRLVSQLADLESAKSDGLIDQTEYDETLKETKDQLIEFEQSLARFKEGAFYLSFLSRILFVYLLFIL